MGIPENHQLYLVLAAFNEASVLSEVISEIRDTIRCSIVVVDDGSTDNTAQVAKDCGAILIKHPINRGAGAACQTGILLARREGWQRVGFMDADGQHVPKDLDGLLTKMKESGADLVIGSRFQEDVNKIPFLRKFYNFLANVLTNIFCHSNFSDTQSGFRLLNRNAIESINLLQDDFSYCSEMIIQAEKLGLKVVETPIEVRYTDYSVTKGQDFQVGLTTAFHLLWKIIFK